MEAYYIAGQTMLYRADFAGARASFETALARSATERTRSSGSPRRATMPASTSAAIWRSSLWHLGYPDQALSVNHEVCRMAREMGHPFSLAYCLHHTAWLYQFCRLGRRGSDGCRGTDCNRD